MNSAKSHSSEKLVWLCILVQNQNVESRAIIGNNQILLGSITLGILHEYSTAENFWTVQMCPLSKGNRSCYTSAYN